MFACSKEPSQDNYSYREHTAIYESESGLWLWLGIIAVVGNGNEENERGDLIA